jgi:hypothetical protein
MYLGAKLEVGTDCGSARDSLAVCTDDSGMTSTGVELVCCVVKLYDTFEPLLPDSEQFRLQQSRASETSGALVAEWAFLQQSGNLVSGQEPSCRCAPVPTTLISIAAITLKMKGRFSMVT